MLRDGTSLYRIMCYVYQLLFADCSLRLARILLNFKYLRLSV